MNPKILYIGGVKSGKSGLAEHRALTLAAEQIPLRSPFYLATTDSSDRSMADRIQRHQQKRGDRFVTVEEPLDLIHGVKTIAQTHTLEAGQGVILIDCLTLWLSNRLLQDFQLYWEAGSEAEFIPRLTAEPLLEETIAALLRVPHSVIFVINDVGSGIHADTAIGRRFTDLSGIVAQHIAAGCTEVYHCIAGIGNRIK